MNLVFRAVGVRLRIIPTHGDAIFTVYDIEGFTSAVNGAGLLHHAEACALVLRSAAIRQGEKYFAFNTRRHWERAVEKFQQVVRMNGNVGNPDLLVKLVKAIIEDNRSFLFSPWKNIFFKKTKKDMKKEPVRWFVKKFCQLTSYPRNLPSLQSNCSFRLLRYLQ